MQIVHFTATQYKVLDALPSEAVTEGFVWVFLPREQLEAGMLSLQALMQEQTKSGEQLGHGLLDLHMQDLLNPQHPSHYDYTSDYDLVIFRRLAMPGERVDASELADASVAASAEPGKRAAAAAAISQLEQIRSRPVGFVVFDRLLISVHPSGCATARQFLERFAGSAGNGGSVGNGGNGGNGPQLRVNRLPQSPADLMLRMINVMVDSYLDLRKVLTQQLEGWQHALLDGNSQFTNWRALLVARNGLHAVEDLCEEQHDAMQEWLDTLLETAAAGPERDILVARTRDVIEHIERVLHHVRRLEQGAEAAVQMHFSATANRANSVMRILTALTAIFLPLNLITGVFGMNFKSMPLLENPSGFWQAIGAMAIVGLSIMLIFRHKRYLRSRV